MKNIFLAALITILVALNSYAEDKSYFQALGKGNSITTTVSFREMSKNELEIIARRLKEVVNDPSSIADPSYISRTQKRENVYNAFKTSDIEIYESQQGIKEREYFQYEEKLITDPYFKIQLQALKDLAALGQYCGLAGKILFYLSNSDEISILSHFSISGNDLRVGLLTAYQEALDDDNGQERKKVDKILKEFDPNTLLMALEYLEASGDTEHAMTLYRNIKEQLPHLLFRALIIARSLGDKTGESYLRQALANHYGDESVASVFVRMSSNPNSYISDSYRQRLKRISKDFVEGRNGRNLDELYKFSYRVKFDPEFSVKFLAVEQMLILALRSSSARSTVIRYLYDPPALASSDSLRPDIEPMIIEQLKKLIETVGKPRRGRY